MKTYFEMIDGVPIPLSYLEKGLQEGLQQIRMYENIAGLERIAAAGPDKLLYYSIDLELCGYITQLLQKNGQEVAVVYARQRISSRAVVSMISIVKTRLLDMMLELEDELNNYDPSMRTEIKPNQSLNDKIIQIMNHYSISGDGNVLNTGDSNKIKVKTQIERRDLDSLRKVLQEYNVASEDVMELERIITVEEPDLEKKLLGSKVNGWIGTMFNKALNGTWNLGTQVATGAAGGLLVEIIKKYYGM